MKPWDDVNKRDGTFRVRFEYMHTLECTRNDISDYLVKNCALRYQRAPTYIYTSTQPGRAARDLDLPGRDQASPIWYGKMREPKNQARMHVFFFFGCTHFSNNRNRRTQAQHHECLKLARSGWAHTRHAVKDAPANRKKSWMQANQVRRVRIQSLG